MADDSPLMAPTAAASRCDAPALAGRPVSVTLPTLLLRLFPGAVRRLEVPAATVAEVIDALDARWPGMRDRLCDSRPRIRRHINVFVAGERAMLETPLPQGVEVIIMTAISGG
jgi:sulfur-carrier protein